MAVKKSFQPINEALINYSQTATVADLMADSTFTRLMEAKKGGFSGVDSFVTIDGEKVARVCAMTGAVFAHDNSDKNLSFFYKNGSYMIGAEVVKANARKAWELDKETEEAELENDMLEGNILPKEWKEAKTALDKKEFEFDLDEETKSDLIASFGGIIVLDENDQPDHEASKAEWTAQRDELAPFSDYSEEIKALRDLAPKREEDEAEAEEA